jgi:anti-sigma regulatory factor (Ser/Thr protein kinase)
MKELSLNVLDIAENGVKAGASLVTVGLTEQNGKLTLVIADNGCGMSQETVEKVLDPFYTTRTTRAVGLGLPLLKLEAEQTGGAVTVASTVGEGTTVTAIFHTDHIDCPPVGDMAETMVTLIQGHPEMDFLFTHQREEKETVKLDTRELRQVLEDVPLNSFDVLQWIRAFLQEQYLL